jgi:hypothetical protein
MASSAVSGCLGSVTVVWRLRRWQSSIELPAKVFLRWFAEAEHEKAQLLLQSPVNLASRTLQEFFPCVSGFVPGAYRVPQDQLCLEVVLPGSALRSPARPRCRR